MATEVGNVYPLSKAAPDKTVIPASPEAVCAYMKQNTLRKVYQSLRDGVHEITVDPDSLTERGFRSSACSASFSPAHLTTSFYSLTRFDSRSLRDARLTSMMARTSAERKIKRAGPEMICLNLIVLGSGRLPAAKFCCR
jgi:hypothetical protein